MHLVGAHGVGIDAVPILVVIEEHVLQGIDGVPERENYVAPCDMTIGETPVVKGTWIITAECANDEVWQAIQKGELTGFSMGGVGKYSEQDVPLDPTALTTASPLRVITSVRMRLKSASASCTLSGLTVLV